MKYFPDAAAGKQILVGLTVTGEPAAGRLGSDPGCAKATPGKLPRPTQD